MKNKRIISFDCDGVMFDTVAANQMYYNRILTHLGQPLMTPEQFAYTHMHTVHAALDFLFPDPDLRLMAEEVRKRLNYFDLIPHMVIEPGLKTLLSKLRPVMKTAVATNRSDTMDRVLEVHGLVGCFDLVVCALDVPRPKPFPDPLLKILTHFHAPPRDAVYVGDSEVDAQAAAAAGIQFIAYRNSALPADRHIEHLAEIAGILCIE